MTKEFDELKQVQVSKQDAEFAEEFDGEDNDIELEELDFDGEEPEVITIANDEGVEEDFEVILKFDVDATGDRYMMLVPLYGEDTEGDDEEEVFPFRYEEEGDELKLYPIEKEEEWAIVEETFNTFVDQLDDDSI
jgi:uncharacterized protein YrzB (UPF0473 family)